MQRQRQDAPVARHFHDGRPPSRRRLPAWNGVPGPNAPLLEARHDDAVDGSGLNTSFHGKHVALLHRLNRGIHLHFVQCCPRLLPKFLDVFYWHDFPLPCPVRRWPIAEARLWPTMLSNSSESYRRPVLRAYLTSPSPPRSPAAAMMNNGFTRVVTSRIVAAAV